LLAGEAVPMGGKRRGKKNIKKHGFGCGPRAGPGGLLKEAGGCLQGGQPMEESGTVGEIATHEGGGFGGNGAARFILVPAVQFAEANSGGFRGGSPLFFDSPERQAQVGGRPSSGPGVRAEKAGKQFLLARKKNKTAVLGI